MDNTCDNRFDPNVVAHILLDMAHEQTLDKLLEKFVCRGIERPDIACVQIWLIDKGDRCSHCPRRPDCHSRSLKNGTHES